MDPVTRLERIRTNLEKVEGREERAALEKLATEARNQLAECQSDELLIATYQGNHGV